MRGQGGMKEVAAMAWPLAVGMLSYTMMGITDTLLMGRVGTEAQAAVGLGAILAWTFLAFFRGLVTGCQSLVGAADGAGDRVRAARAAASGLLLAVGGGVVGVLGLAAVLLWAVDALAGDPVLGAHARAYLWPRLPGVPLDLLGVSLMAALQGLGDTRARMWASLSGNLVNVALDLVLIFGWGAIPAMGAAGAGWATSAGVLTMLLVYALRFAVRFGRLRRPTLEVLRSTCAVGLPAGTQYLLGTVAFMVINVALARAGAAELAASQIVLNIISVSFLPGFGVGEASGVLVSRYLGAGRPRTADRAVRSGRRLALWIMGLCGLGFALGGESIAALFNPDPAVIEVAGKLMLFAAVFQLFDAVVMVHLCALRAAGDTRFTLLVTTAAAWGITVPLTLLFTFGLGWGATGAWLALTAEIAALALMTTPRAAGLRTGRVGRLDLLLGAKSAGH